MVGHGSVVPFWTCKVEIPIRCNSCCFKTKEWLVIESYGRPIRFLFTVFALRNWREEGSDRGVKAREAVESSL